MTQAQKTELNIETQKLNALAAFLEVAADDIMPSTYSDDEFEHGGGDYKVLTDDEADNAAKENILESVWAFNPSFIASHSHGDIDEETIKAIQSNGKCEGNNAVLTRLIKDIDHFVNDAILSDGRGHFLSGYDGEENEQGEFYIYRTN